MRMALVLLLSVSLAPMGALASDRPQLSTQDELRRCLTEGDALEDERLAIESAGRRLESVQGSLQTLNRLHAAKRPVVMNRRSQAAIDAFNQRSQELNAIGRGLNERAAGLLERQNRFNADIDQSNARCAGMTISVDDHEIVLLERVKQAAAR